MVKIIGIIGMVLLVSFIFASTYLMIADIETNYIERNISQIDPINSSLEYDLDKTSQLNESFAPVLAGFQNFGRDEGGFKIFESIVAIPQAIIALPGALLSLGSIAIDIFIIITRDVLKIPQSFIAIGSIGILMVIIILLVTSWRRYDA